MPFGKQLNLSTLCLVILTLALAAAGTACGGSGTSTTATPPSTTSGAVSLAGDVQPIFNSKCVVCHQGASANEGLRLEPGSAYSNLVNIKSKQSALERVLPGQPDNSYLLNKLLGTQAQAGGSGVQMPYGASPLSQSQIDLIRQWIAQGALNN